MKTHFLILSSLEETLTQNLSSGTVAGLASSEATGKN